MLRRKEENAQLRKLSRAGAQRPTPNAQCRSQRAEVKAGSTIEHPEHGVPGDRHPVRPGKSAG